MIVNQLTLALKRFWPLGLVALSAILFFTSGAHRCLTFDSLAMNHASLNAAVEANPVVAWLAAGLLYVVAVAIAFPAAWLITVAIGLLFGWVSASILVVISATIGACLLYFVARYVAADFFRQKAGPRLNQMAEGFQENAVSYLLFLRLAPIFPFLLVNVVPAILNVNFRTFAWTTAIGIIPGTIAYTFAGEGLRSIVADRANACALSQSPCGEPFGASDLITSEVLIAVTLLAVISLLPVVLKRMRGGQPSGENS